jgi:hypothetical protein
MAMFRKLFPALLAPVLVVGWATAADDATVRLDAGAQGVAALRAAPDVAAEAGTLRFEMTIEVGGGADDRLTVTATGAVDTAAQRSAMQLDMGSALTVLGSGSDLPAGTGEPMEVIVDGATTTYLRVPFLAPVTGTSGWLAATEDDLGGPGDAFGLGLGPGSADPSQILEALRSVADDVERLGVEEVRGVATTRYRATIDLRDTLDAWPEDEREGVEGIIGRTGGEALGPVPVDVWVGDDGLARRIRLDLASLGSVMGAVGDATVTLELFAYGEPVTIDVPDPADVTPIGDVLGAFGGFGGLGFPEPNGQAG